MQADRGYAQCHLQAVKAGAATVQQAWEHEQRRPQRQTCTGRQHKGRCTNTEATWRGPQHDNHAKARPICVDRSTREGSQGRGRHPACREDSPATRGTKREKKDGPYTTAPRVTRESNKPTKRESGCTRAARLQKVLYVDVTRTLEPVAENFAKGQRVSELTDPLRVFVKGANGATTQPVRSSTAQLDSERRTLQKP